MLQLTCCTWGCGVLKYLRKSRLPCCTWGCGVLKYLRKPRLTCCIWGCGVLKYLRKPRLTCCTWRCRALTPVFTGTWPITVKYITRSQLTYLLYMRMSGTHTMLTGTRTVVTLPNSLGSQTRLYAFQVCKGKVKQWQLRDSDGYAKQTWVCKIDMSVRNRHECAK